MAAYTSIVRLTHRKSGAYKEDCGAGDAIDKSMGSAIANALKSSVTDAMKRAARHFGDKLGNCTYFVKLPNPNFTLTQICSIVQRRLYHEQSTNNVGTRYVSVL